MTAFLASAARSGVVQRTSPEWSDLFLFVLAAAAVWFVRRRLRARFRRKD